MAPTEEFGDGVGPGLYRGEVAMLRGARAGWLLDLGRTEEADAELRAAYEVWDSLSSGNGDYFPKYSLPEGRALLRDLATAADRSGDAADAAEWRRRLDELLALAR